MKLKEFAKLIEVYPIRLIEEHVIVLSGVDTTPYEDILVKHGCTRSEWSDLIHGQVHLGTYVVVPKPVEGFEPDKIDPAIFEHYCMEFKCEPTFGERTWFTLMVNWAINEYEEKTGEKAPSYEEWSDDIKNWFAEHYIQEEMVIEQLVDKLIKGGIPWIRLN